MIEIKVNGEILKFQSEMSVAEFLRERGYRAEFIAVECDGKIIKRQLWGEVKISSGNSYEIVEFVGGG